MRTILVRLNICVLTALSFALTAEPGDVNLDGSLTVADRDGIVAHLLGTELLEGDALINADFNGDGNVDAADVVALGRLSLPLETISQAVGAIEGGTVRLDGGSSVVVPPGALPYDAIVTLSLAADLRVQPPSGLLEGAGPALVFSIVPDGPTPTPSPTPVRTPRPIPPAGFAGVGSVPAGPVPTEPFQFTIDLSSADPSAALQGSAPLADIVDLSGGDHFVGVPGTFDPQSMTATMSLPPELALGGREVSVGLVNLATQIRFAPPPRFGARIWNPALGQWLDFPQGFDPSKRTLITVHGVMSNVETAFGGCIDPIAQAGGYDQVIGFNYDWTESVDNAGARLGQFMNQLSEAGVANVDVMAHSYGAVVSLSAASNTDLPIGNFVLEGGPLNGTPFSSDPADHPFVLAALANVITWNELLSDSISPTLNSVQDLLASGALIDLQPGSPVLERIRTDVRAAHPNATFVKVVGTRAPDAPQFVLDYLAGFLDDPAQDYDGIIPATSASADDLPGPTLPFDLVHTDLECDPAVIEQVGAIVAPTPTPTPTPTPSPTPSPTPTPAPTPNPTATPLPSETWVGSLGGVLIVQDPCGGGCTAGEWDLGADVSVTFTPGITFGDASLSVSGSGSGSATVRKQPEGCDPVVSCEIFDDSFAFEFGPTGSVSGSTVTLTLIYEGQSVTGNATRDQDVLFASFTISPDADTSISVTFNLIRQ